MNNAYQKLCQRFTRLSHLSHLGAIGGWDMQTMMPSGGSQARGKALAELSLIKHQLLTEPVVAELLESAQHLELDAIQQANLREMQRHYQQAAILPGDLVSAKALAGSRCEHAWRTQRPANDWQGFATNLTQVVALSREEAVIRGEAQGISPYDALLDLYEPGMTASKLDQLFGEMKSWLPELLVKVVDRQAAQPSYSLDGQFAVQQQQKLGLAVMELLGFDFQHGRLDISAHPFCGGVPEDVRITTRYNSREFISALMGVIHETGHARYEQNLPKQWAGQPIALARSMAVHESQSLFMEMQLARGPEFLGLLLPLIRSHLRLPETFTEQKFINLAQRVQPGKIRVDADEVSYPAHIILRYEIERELISETIEVADIPELWDLKMQQYLGVDTAGDYQNGCMQDIHWTDGAIGYFPTYTLGAMYAAQLFQALLKQQPGLMDNIARGELNPVFDWLKTHIWQQGSRYSSEQLIEKATGSVLAPEAFRLHLEQRYLG